MADKKRDDKRMEEPDKTAPPPNLREDPDWLESIGPEDASEETVIQNLNDYGFNQMDEDDFESDPVAPSDMPSWTENAVYGEDRPLMPDPEDELEDRADDEARPER